MPFDAIGNDVAQMRAVLLESGYNARIFAEGIHPDCGAIADSINKAPEGLWNSTEDILIYHHGVGWPRGEDILFKSRNKLILRYHNITPAKFFVNYSEAHTNACEKGYESTPRIAQIPNKLILGDSTYNCDDLIAMGARRDECRVLAPFHLIEELGRERFDIGMLKQYSGATVNILFVGGVKPNKGHARAIRVLAEYHRHYNDRSRLIFAGGLDDRLNGYVEELRQLAAQLQVSDSVIFTGPVSTAQIKSLYASADVFLCTSEHEGFCVPLVEAMYFRVPVVAWNTTAVPETMGNSGFVLDEWDEFAFASHIDRVVEDDQLSDQIGTLGRKRYAEAFAPHVLRKSLCKTVAEVAQRGT